MNPQRDTLFSGFVEAVGRYGRRSSGQWEDMKPGSYSYGDLLEMTLALGRLISKISAEGEHVGLLMPNMAVTAGLLIGASAFRRVPCMLNYTAGAEGVSGACRTARIRLVITSREFIARANLSDEISRLQGVELCLLEDLRKRFGLADKLWLMGFARHFPLRAVPQGDAESPAVVLFTSGSEGKPKGVVLSHRAVLSQVEQIREILPLRRDDKIFNALPIFHSLGLTAGVFMPLYLGIPLFMYVSPLHYKTIPQLIGEKRCATLFATSTFLNHYAAHATREQLRTLRFVIAGAEKLAEPVRSLWQDEFGIDILEGYGTTELAPVVSVNLPGASRPGSVGRLLPRIEARLVPVPGIERGGELHLRGPNLMSGYYRYERPGRLEPPASSVGTGWYNTGDVVDIDADGYLSIIGRLKRFAKVAGEMVPLEMAEDIARAASVQAMHAAICTADLSRGEAIVLFTTDSSLTREQLHVAAHGMGYPEIAVPRRIHVMDNLPLLGSGKIDYARLNLLGTQA